MVTTLILQVVQVEAVGPPLCDVRLSVEQTVVVVARVMNDGVVTMKSRLEHGTAYSQETAY